MSEAVIATFDPRFEVTPGEELIVEVWNDHIRPWVFPPIKYSAPLRARFVMSAMTSSGRLPHKSVATMPDLPGIRIAVNPSRRICRYFDPLGVTAEGQKLWTQAKAKIEAAKNFIANCEVEKEQHFFFECTDDEIKTWLYWIRRGHDGKLVKLVEGSLPMPTPAEIAALPGKTEVNQLNSMTHKRRFLEDDTDYRPPVDPRRRELVGASAAGEGGRGRGRGQQGNQGNQNSGSQRTGGPGTASDPAAGGDSAPESKGNPDQK